MSDDKDDKVDLILFCPGDARAEQPRYERLMAQSRVALTLDMVELGLQCDLIDRIIVATASATLARHLAEYDRVYVDLDVPGKPFHFGERLVEIIERLGVRHPLYFGGSGAPLYSAESLEELCGYLLSAERTVIANNLRSADFFGFTPPEALRRIALPASQDNSIPWLLMRQGGLDVEPLEPAIENTFDIDTPSDLAILSLFETAKRHVRAVLDEAQLDTARLLAVMPHLVSINAEVTLVGRVATHIWGRSWTDIPGQKRLYVEERGLKATGRAERGEVRSLLGYLVQEVGPKRMFEYLASFSSAIFFDTRPLFYHLGLHLSDNDRYASDVGDVEAIADPSARAITAAALACEKPVILGGRNIVSGGLWALTQEAWNRADAGLIHAQET